MHETHELASIIHVRPAGVLLGPATGYYATCTCGWADECDRSTETEAREIHANHVAAY